MKSEANEKGVLVLRKETYLRKAPQSFLRIVVFFHMYVPAHEKIAV